VSEPVRYSRVDDIGLITIDNPPVNALGVAVRRGLLECLQTGLEDDAARALVLIGAGRTFPAGADIREFDQQPQSPSLPDVVAGLEASGKLLIAAIHGTALGGGMEITLGCDYRIAAPDARMGLPEVNLGLLPGAGGTQRLPRLAGVRPALDIAVNGRPVGVSRLQDMGVVDRVATQDLQADALAYARELAAADAPRRPLGELAPAAPDEAAFDEFEQLVARKKRGYEAPAVIIEAVRTATQTAFADGMVRERELFVERRNSAQAAAQRYIFFAERKAGKMPDIPADASARDIRTAAVIGAGTMGTGIAITLADAGLPVTLLEQDSEALARGRDKLERHYRGQVDKQRMNAATADQRLASITPTTDYVALADVDLVIEAVFEDMDVKREVFAQLDRHCRADAILGTNTSTLDVGAIAEQTQRPENVVGLHFFSPAHIMRLVEIVRASATGDVAMKTAAALVKRIGKIGVPVGVCYGFVGNRILHKRQAQAVNLVTAGATPEQVDRVLYEFGMPMGPLAMWDMAGLDISYKAREHVRAHDPSNAPPRNWVDEVVEAGRLGQKTDGGVFDYDGRKPVPSPATAQHIESFRARQGITPRDIDDAEVRERCLYVMVNEACRILDEGIAARPSDIDVVWINGYGFPRYRGGPMHWADRVGLADILERIRHFHDTTGDPDWAPAPLLERLVAEGRQLGDLN